MATNQNLITVGLIGNLWDPITNATVNSTTHTMTTNSYAVCAQFIQNIHQNGGFWDDLGRWIGRDAIGIIRVS
jgi:hypothetical protein